jgi:flagellar FliL protein
MAKPAKPADTKKAEAPAAAAPAPKGKKKLIIIIIAAVALLGVAGGAALFLMKDKSPPAETVKVAAVKEPKFIPLEAFTVNLQKEESDQYLQISITLKVTDPEFEDKIKAVLPEIRSKLNLLLSSKRPSELATLAGKKKLAIDIATETNGVLGIHNAPEPVAAVAASGVAPSSAGEAASAPVGEPVAEHPAEHAPDEPATSEKAEKKGVVDVLFTSFIIQ